MRTQGVEARNQTYQEVNGIPPEVVTQFFDKCEEIHFKIEAVFLDYENNLKKIEEKPTRAGQIFADYEKNVLY